MHQRRRSWPLAVGALLLVAVTTAALAPRRVEAQSESRAAESRAHFDRAVALIAERQFEEAIRELEQARAIYPTASIHFNLGIAYREVGRPRMALMALQRFLDAMGERVDPQRRAEVDRYMAQARASLARVRLDILPESADVSIDGEPIAHGQALVELDPGEHAVHVELDGYEPDDRTVRVEPGGEILAQVRLRALSRPASLEIVTDVASAVIRVDGEISGQGSARLELAGGPHTVEVSAEGYESATRAITLVDGSEERWVLELTRRGSNVLEEGAFWGVLGGLAAVGLGVGLAFALWPPADGPATSGGLGVVDVSLMEVLSW